MLGVMRFKSTGDMLTTSGKSEQFASRRGASRGQAIRADSEEDVDYCGTNDDEDNNNNLEEHEELARTSRPLLFGARNVYSGADEDDESYFQNGCRRQWKSCKLLGATSSSSNRRNEANYHDDLERSKQTTVRSNKKRPAVDDDLAGDGDDDLASRQLGGKQLSKSTGDFLAALVLRNTSQQASGAATRVKLYSSGDDDDDDDDERYDSRRAENRLRAPVGVQLEATAAPTIATWSLVRPFGCSSASSVRPAQLSGKNLANSKVASGAVSKSRRRTTTSSGARNKRRRAQVTQQHQHQQQQQVIRPASRLSLSSPALAQAKPSDEGQLATLKQHSQLRGCQASEDTDQDEDEVYADAAADDTELRQQREQQHSPESADRYGETKASAGEHCVVDVGRILCQTLEASGRLDAGSNCVEQVHCDLVAANETRKLSGVSARASDDDDNGRLEERLLSVCNLGVGGKQQQRRQQLRFYDGQLVALASTATNPTSTLTEQSPRDFVSPVQQSPSFHRQQQREKRGSFGNACENNQLLMLAEQPKPVGVVAVHCQQERDNSKSTATASGSITNKLMVDLNSAAYRLMDTCCNSWLGQTLQPTHFGSYKVNQPALDCCVSISGSQQSLALQEQEESSGSGSDRSPALLATVAGGRQHQAAVLSSSDSSKERASNANSRIARYSRPGRSPVSLQRQTNARLARHRLKIQQQRQEQLAQLALRERPQFSNSTDGNSSLRPLENPQRVARENPHCQAPSTIEAAIAIAARDQRHQQQASPLENPHHHQLLATRRRQQQRETSDGQQQESLYIINGLIDRLSFGRLSSRLGSSAQQQEHQQQQQGLLDTLQVDRLTGGGQHQVIEVTARRDRRPIEICDSQLAGSSGQQSSGPGDTKRASQRSSGGNVIVYKSINMLQNKRASMGQSSENGTRSATDFQPDEDAIESDSQTICSSDSTLSLNRPFCKICHLGSSKNGDKLISPCRCSGTMQYIHCGCLLKWLEISNRSNEKPISCELCAHEYTWHKKFNYKQMRLPRCSFKDSILHTIFVLAIGVMFFSALAPMVYKRSPPPPDASTIAASSSADQQQARTASHNGAISARMVGAGSGDITTSYHITRGVRNHHHNGHLQAGSAAIQQQQQLASTSRLAQDEKFMLLCAASFFVSFFVAIYVQTKARDTLYGLIVKFLSMNKTYYITEYDHGQLNGANGSSSSNSATGNSGGGGGGNNNSGGNNSNNSGGNSESNNCNCCGGSRCGANRCLAAAAANGTLK